MPTVIISDVSINDGKVTRRFVITRMHYTRTDEVHYANKYIDRLLDGVIPRVCREKGFGYWMIIYGNTWANPCYHECMYRESTEKPFTSKYIEVNIESLVIKEKNKVTS